jgi:site-specific DNA recombinase
MRQPRDLERLVDLGDRGVLVWSCYGDYDLSSADDRFTLRVLTAAAAKDSDNTSRRQKRRAQARREQGKRNGGPRPFGCPTLSKDGEPVPAAQLQAERDAIAWAVRAHLDGVSLHAIAREWNARGLRTRGGKNGPRKWDSRQLHHVLCGPWIAGLLAYQGKVLGELRDANGEPVEPIVSREDWEAIVSTFKSRRRGRPTTDPYLLSGGYLMCGACGQPMSGKVASGHPRADGTPRRRYVCRDREGICSTRVTIDAVRAEVDARDIVVRVLSNPKNARRMAQASAKLAEAEEKLARAKKTATELARRLGEDEMDLDAYDAAAGPLKRRIERLTAERDALLDAGAGEEARAASAAEVAAEWDDPDATVEHRRVMVRAAAPRGIAVLPASPEQKSSHTKASRLRRVPVP